MGLWALLTHSPRLLLSGTQRVYLFTLTTKIEKPLPDSGQDQIPVMTEFRSRLSDYFAHRSTAVQYPISLCFSTAVQNPYSTHRAWGRRQKSRVERVKENVEPLLTSVTVENTRAHSLQAAPSNRCLSLRLLLPLSEEEKTCHL